MLDEVTSMTDTALPDMKRPLTNEPRTSFTLPSEYYTSPAVYEREKEAIFYRILPGSNELAVLSIRPLDHEWTSFEGHVLTADGRANEARTPYAANVLAPEDIALCESVQRGLKSKGYDQGPIMAGEVPTGENEFAVHHFHRLVLDALNGAA